MGLYRGQKSFRVIGTKVLSGKSKAHPIGNFAFTRYNHASNMWKSEIWDNNVVKRVKAQLEANGSNEKDAQEIQRIINWVATILNKAVQSAQQPNSVSISPEEADVIRSLGLVRWINKTQGESHLAMSLLDFVSDGKYQGVSFENRINELFRSLFVGGEAMDFREGKTTNTIRADEMINVKKQLGDQVFEQVVELINSDSQIKKNAQESGSFSLGGAKYQDLRTAIRSHILEAANLNLNNLFNGPGIEVFFNRSQGGAIQNVIITKVRKQQKIDINVNNQSAPLEIDRSLHKDLQNLAELIRGKSFTLKNYLETTYKKSGYSLGDTSEGRMWSALFTYASGNTTYSDVATFIYSTREVGEQKRKDSTLERYEDWGRTIYELLGVGSRGDNRIPDYFIGNVYTADQLGTGKVIVHSTLKYLDGAPYGTNSFVFKSGSSIRV